MPRQREASTEAALAAIGRTRGARREQRAFSESGQDGRWVDAEPPNIEAFGTGVSAAAWITIAPGAACSPDFAPLAFIMTGDLASPRLASPGAGLAPGRALAAWASPSGALPTLLIEHVLGVDAYMPDASGTYRVAASLQIPYFDCPC